MEALLKEHERLERKTNLKKAVDDVAILIDQLRQTRDQVAKTPTLALPLLDNMHKSATIQFEHVNTDLKDIYGGLGKYGKTMERKFKDRSLPFAEQDALSMHTGLINRAIAMHLLREGHFEVAATFISEANTNADPLALPSTISGSPMDLDSVTISNAPAAIADHLVNTQTAPVFNDQPAVPPATRNGNYQPDSLQLQFQEMYHILNSLRHKHDLGPAISWARTHSVVLEARGSNLEYDLCQLQYISLFVNQGPTAALKYARETFQYCPQRYAAKIQRLVGALAFLPNIGDSPYAELFSASNADTVAAAASAFTAEFCALLSLSSASPLLTAVTAGCIALPTLLKLSQIQASHRTSWTTASELPVEVPLPPAYSFHSIFVCPVSKEQSTDDNPPMMMPCYHVICKESLDRVSRGGRFKCPYCPAESHKDQAKRVFV